MTTVGYADIAPETNLGRANAIPVMVMGIGFLSLLNGAVAQRFASVEVEQEVTDVEEALVAELGATETELLGELRLIAERLRLRVEAAVVNRLPQTP